MENQCPHNFKTLLPCAVKGGNLELIKWIHSTLNLALNKPNLCTTAIQFKHWKVFHWLLDNGCEPNDETMMVALNNAQLSLETLIDIYEYTCNNQLILPKVAKKGRKDFIDWLVNNDEIIDLHADWNFIIMGALRGNHLDILKTAFINCRVCTKRLQPTEYPELYKWLNKQGCIEF